MQNLKCVFLSITNGLTLCKKKKNGEGRKKRKYLRDWRYGSVIECLLFLQKT